jgi:hypothetical protein
MRIVHMQRVRGADIRITLSIIRRDLLGLADMVQGCREIVNEGGGEVGRAKVFVGYR